MHSPTEEPSLKDVSIHEKIATNSGDSEKAGVERLERVLTTQDAVNERFGFSPEERKRIMRHIDRRLVLTVGALYCVSLMDRTNLGAANIAGMSKDLVLGVENRYSIISLVFFVSYVLFQAPSTVVVRKIGPRHHITTITVLWGCLMVGMGFVKDWGQMAGLRVLLGVLEAGFFPSVVYLLSTWYTRFELGKRNSVFFMVGCVASAFAGILAYGIMQMAGLAGLNGWRWIFIIEGILTVLLGIAAYWLLVDFPDSKRATWSFLTERERQWVCARVEADRGDVQVAGFSLKEYLKAALDIKIWGYAIIFFNTTTITYALAYFLPLILTGNMGFTVAQAQCLVAPPYAFAGFVMYFGSWASDKYRMRGAVIVFNMMLCIIGLPIMGFHPNANVRYFGVFLVTAGANSNVPAAMTYQANNIRGQWKRAFASASFVAFGGIGGISGSLVFRAQDAPHYKPGLYACIATTLLTLVIVAVLSVTFWIENRRADRGEKELETDEKDYQPGFRYTI
ncbi:major facilitator superfamily domain-containing protein [Bombardia bombarda]|uniref:Major facilitator superfamily domain-containing protein n=1 Tax=Bombardia bombarda TaxID=252184 RepID=A0AA39X182_9PEZI|nr:major facilitator superfamily domain-containing protein [Bombardia bombarda]